MAEQVDSSHQSCQGGDHKKQDEDDPVVVQHAFVGSRFLCWDHVGEVQHVAKGPADGGFSCLWKQLGMVTTLVSPAPWTARDLPGTISLSAQSRREVWRSPEHPESLLACGSS